MAARMLPAIMSLEKRIAMSDQGKVAVLKKPENCIEIYGKGETDNPEQQWMPRRLCKGLVMPYDVCFAPNNHLVVSDINDKFRGGRETSKSYDHWPRPLPSFDCT